MVIHGKTFGYVDKFHMYSHVHVCIPTCLHTVVLMMATSLGNNVDQKTIYGCMGKQIRLRALTHTQATMWSKRRAVRPVTLELLKARETIEKMAR